MGEAKLKAAGGTYRNLKKPILGYVSSHTGGGGGIGGGTLFAGGNLILFLRPACVGLSII